MKNKKRTSLDSFALLTARNCDLPTWFIALVLGLIALIPRTLTLNDFFTVDESFHWVWRVMHFTNALRKENWAGTNLTGHPGVTTMWLGSLGRKIAFAAGFSGPEWEKGSVTYLALLRLPLALVNGCIVGLSYPLLRRLLRPQTALLAGLLWAFSPFLIAHSRLLHLDGLLTSFMTLTILLLLTSCIPIDMEHPLIPPTSKQWILILASGLCAGLAFLTKAPSLLLLPTATLLFVIFSPPHTLWSRLVWIVSSYSAWMLIALLTIFLLWPALWVDPLQAIGRVLDEVIFNGAQPHESGNYFLGQPVDDPGWLFYPAVILWRNTPITLIGLLLLPWSTYTIKQERTTLLALGSVVLIITFSFSILAKKFDRYLLPIWPSLEILAAIGIMSFLDWYATTYAKSSILRFRYSLVQCSIIAIAILSFMTSWWYHPYYLAYFNPLLGGGAIGQKVMLAGWGEGMEQVGAWLRSRPDMTRSPVISWDPRTLEPFVPVRVVPLDEASLQEPASYAVLYSRGIQRQEEAVSLQQIQQHPPLYTLHLYGIDYAYVYQPAYPFTTARDALFGEGVHLRGFRQEEPDDQTVVISLSWDIQHDQEGGLFCFVHILDSHNNRIAQVDVPIDEGLFPQWQTGQQFGSPLPIPLPKNLPQGEYRVAIGVYHPVNYERLPIHYPEPLPPNVDGPEVLLLTTITR